MKKMKKDALILFVLSIQVLLSSCTKNSSYIINSRLMADDIVKISSIAPIIALADSNSQIIIRVNVNSNADSAQNITLTTNEGIINGKSKSETLLTNLSRFGEFVLTTGQSPGPVTLRASVQGSYFRDTIINFTKSYPDSIIVQPDEFIISKNAEVNVSVNLFRNKGYPSKNQTLLLSSMDSTGNSTGKFITIGDFVPSQILATKFIPEQDFIGKVKLNVFIIREDGSKLMGSSNIVIK